MRGLTNRAFLEVGDDVSQWLATFDPLVRSLALMCHSNSELVAAVRSDKSLFDWNNEEKALKHFDQLFRSNAPREIYTMFEGEIADRNREAIIVRNFASGRISEYDYNEIANHFCERMYRDDIDGRVPTVGRTIRRVLANRTISQEVRKYFILGLAMAPSPTLSDIVASSLKTIPVDSDAIYQVLAGLRDGGKRACLRVQAWVGPVINEDVEARRLIRELLKSEDQEVKVRSANLLLQSLRPDDLTSDLIILAFGTDEKLATAIRKAISPEVIRQQTVIHMIPLFKEGKLSESQSFSLASMIGTDPAITTAFLGLAAQIDDEWDGSYSGASAVIDFIELVGNPQAKLPKILWDMITNFAKRSEHHQILSSAIGNLVLSHPDEMPGHDLLFYQLSRDSVGDRICDAAVALASRNAAFEGRLYDAVRWARFQDRAMHRLVLVIAATRPDEKSQALIARFVHMAASAGENDEILDALHRGLSHVDWTHAVVSAIEKLAETENKRALVAELLSSRVPGTSEVLPKRQSELKKRLWQRQKELVSSPPLADHRAEIPVGDVSGYGVMGQWGDWHFSDGGEPAALHRSAYPDPKRAFVLFNKFVIDPHPDVWLYMPTSICEVEITRRSTTKVGDETLVFKFYNGSSFEIGLDDLLDPDFRPKGLDNDSCRQRAFKSISTTGRAGHDNPHSERITVSRMLAVLRANISLMFRQVDIETKTRSAESASIKRPTSQTKAVLSKKPGKLVPSNYDGAERILPYHPHRFIAAYQNTELADAYDKNQYLVFKRSPAQIVVPSLKTSPGERQRLLAHLLKWEGFSLSWLYSGAQVIDLSNSLGDLLADRSEASRFEEAENEETRYVHLGRSQSKTLGDIEGFYFKNMQPNGADRKYYAVGFVFSIPKNTDPLALAQSLSASQWFFLRDDAVLSDSDRIADLALPNSPTPSLELAKLAIRCIALIQGGRYRELRTETPGTIPTPYGRQREGANEWLNEGSPISTYWPDEGLIERKQKKAKELTSPSESDVVFVDEEPDDHDGLTTYFILEEFPDVWKRIKQGDLKQRNGDVVFPQLVNSLRRIMEIKVFLIGKKPGGVISIRPGTMEFDEEGSLYHAFDGWVMEKHHERLAQISNRPRVMDEDRRWKIEEFHIEAARTNLFYGQKATLLTPAYET
jgi:hypothetical protein